MDLFLVAQNQITNNQIFVRVRSLPRDFGPTLAGGQLQFLNPQVTRRAGIQIKIDMFRDKIVWLISDHQCCIR